MGVCVSSSSTARHQENSCRSTASTAELAATASRESTQTKVLHAVHTERTVSSVSDHTVTSPPESGSKAPRPRECRLLTIGSAQSCGIALETSSGDGRLVARGSPTDALQQHSAASGPATDKSVTPLYADGMWFEEELTVACGAEHTGLVPSAAPLLEASGAVSTSSRPGHSSRRLEALSRKSSHAESCSVQLLDALAMDLASERGGTSGSTHRRDARERKRPKMASVLAVSSPEDDTALDGYPMDETYPDNKALWIGGTNAAEMIIGRHGVPGGLLSDGTYVPAVYRKDSSFRGSLSDHPARPAPNNHDYLDANGNDSSSCSDSSQPLRPEPATRSPPELLL